MCWLTGLLGHLFVLTPCELVAFVVFFVNVVCQYHTTSVYSCCCVAYAKQKHPGYKNVRGQSALQIGMCDQKLDIC